MNNAELGRLEQVELRECWKDEAGDFTPWLAENIELVGDAIGVELQVESQEKGVGPFRADILCQDTANGDWVLVENQLERTDHTHMGQLLTYAAGLRAVTAVWIARQFTEEHRAALDWLNDHTDDSISFFGLEVELWKIGDSVAAPKLNVVSKPNDWVRGVRESAHGDLSDTRRLQLDFWTAFHQHMSENSGIRCSKPRPDSYIDHTIGRTGYRFGSNALLYPKVVRAALVIDNAESHEVFDWLQANVGDELDDLEAPLTWHRKDSAQMCRIWAELDADIEQREDWEKTFLWLNKTLQRLHEVFIPLITKWESREVGDFSTPDV